MSVSKPSLDMLFGGCGATDPENEIVVLKLPLLLPYSKHPFKVRECTRLNELIESVRLYGVLTPLLVRIHPTIKGRYEVLAGHHRMIAAERIGLEIIPCLIRNVDDSTAALMVIDSNKQRGFADMLPSEIAKALQLEYDALKCQGKRNDLIKELDSILSEQNLLQNNSLNADDKRGYVTSRPVGEKLQGNNEDNISERNRQRYIRLNFLIPKLLDMVDENKIAIRPAVDLSFLKENEQQLLLHEIEVTEFKVDMKKAEKLKDYSSRKKLDSDIILQIISGDFLEKRAKKNDCIKLSLKRINSLIDTSLTPKEVEDYIINALTFYKQNYK